MYLIFLDFFLIWKKIFFENAIFRSSLIESFIHFHETFSLCAFHSFYDISEHEYENHSRIISVINFEGYRNLNPQKWRNSFFIGLFIELLLWMSEVKKKKTKVLEIFDSVYFHFDLIERFENWIIANQSAPVKILSLLKTSLKIFLIPYFSYMYFDKLMQRETILICQKKTTK